MSRSEQEMGGMYPHTIPVQLLGGSPGTFLGYPGVSLHNVLQTRFPKNCPLLLSLNELAQIRAIDNEALTKEFGLTTCCLCYNRMFEERAEQYMGR